MSTKSKVVCSDLISAVMEKDVDLVQLLVSYGADVNISACCLSYCKHNLLTYEFPIRKEISKPIASEVIQTSTCLMFAVNSPQICHILMKSGAKVNTKNENNLTALHYASKEGNLDTVKLLLEHGAEYFWPGCKLNVLQYAAVHEQEIITEYLIANSEQSVIDIINAYELLGASLVSVRKTKSPIGWPAKRRSPTVSEISHYWMKAMELRHENVCEPLLKFLPAHPIEVYHNAIEPETVAQLKSMLVNEQDLPYQALLIFERILGNNTQLFLDKFKILLPELDDSLATERWYFNIINYGISILEDNRDLMPVNLSLYLLYLKLADMFNNNDVVELMHTLSIVLSTLVEFKSTLYERNIMIERYREQTMDDFLGVIRNWMYRDQPNKEKVRPVIEFVLRTLNPTDAQGGTILHVANKHIANVLNEDVEDGNELIALMQHCYDLINLLLVLGCKINHRDKTGHPALFEAHKFSMPSSLEAKYLFPIKKLMVSYGAHVDIPSVVDIEFVDPPVDRVDFDHPPFNSLKEISLQCLAAHVVVRAKITYRDREDVPPMLVSFISLHDTDVNNLNL